MFAAAFVAAPVPARDGVGASSEGSSSSTSAERTGERPSWCVVSRKWCFFVVMRCVRLSSAFSWPTESATRFVYARMRRISASLYDDEDAEPAPSGFFVTLTWSMIHDEIMALTIPMRAMPVSISPTATILPVSVTG